jgi:hypothetical protein
MLMKNMRNNNVEVELTRKGGLAMSKRSAIKEE